MEKSISKGGAHLSLTSILCVALVRFGSGVFPLQAMLFKQELSFSYTALAGILFAEPFGIIIGLSGASKLPDNTHRKLLQGVLIFLCGNLLTALSSNAWGLFFARILIGLAQFLMGNTVLADTVGKSPPQLVTVLAWHRVTAFAFSVLSPLVGAALIAGRGVCEVSYMMVLWGVFLFLLVASFPLKCNKNAPVTGDIVLERLTLATVFRPVPLLVLFLCGVRELLVIGTGVFVLALSGNLFIAGLTMTLLRLSFWLSKAAISF